MKHSPSCEANSSSTPLVGCVVRRRKLQSNFVWVWGFGFTQTCISGFLLFWPWGYYEPNYRGHLELQYRNRAPLTHYQIMGHKEPLLRRRCIGPGRARAQILFSSLLTVPQIIKKFPAFYRTRISSLSHLKAPANCPFLYYPLIYACGFQVVSLLQVSPPNPYMHLCSPKCLLHAPPISFFSN